MNNQNREEYVDFHDQEYETEGFEDQGFDDGGYQEAAYGDPGGDNVEDEDFPEPGAEGAKKKPSMAMMAGAGALVVCLIAGAGYYAMMGGENGEGGGMPSFASLFGGEESGEPGGEAAGETPTEGEPEGEAAPPPRPKHPKPAVKKPAPKVAVKPKPAAAKKPANDGWTEPVKVASAGHKPAAPAGAAKPKPAALPAKPKPAVEAAKPKPVAPKPAAVAQKPKPVAPKPIAVAPAKVAGGAAPGAHTAVTFAPGSYWVAANEMERLWSFSSGLKATAGHITIEAHPGSAADAADLTRKRANKVAELLRRNNVGNKFDVNVKVGSPAQGSQAERIDIYYTRQL